MTARRREDGRASDTVREAARGHEPDRYLAALLAPSHLRADLIAVAAFSAELWRVRDRVRDPMIGELRLQWWRDALHTLARGERTANPVADALGVAMRRHGLSADLLEMPIEARSRELQEDTDGDMGAVVDAEVALFQAALLVLGLPATPDSGAACADAGAAYAIARQIAVALARQPNTAHDPAQAWAGPGEVMTSMRDRAYEALAAARQRVTALDRGALVAFLPLAMVEPYLRVLERRNAAWSTHFAPITPLSRAWRIWRAKRRRRF